MINKVLKLLANNIELKQLFTNNTVLIIDKYSNVDVDKIAKLLNTDKKNIIKYCNRYTVKKTYLKEIHLTFNVLSLENRDKTDLITEKIIEVLKKDNSLDFLVKFYTITIQNNEIYYENQIEIILNTL